MRKLILSMTIAALMLMGCASGGPPTQTPTLSARESDKQKCLETLPDPASGKTQDLLANHVLAMKAYHECKDRHNGLVNWLEVTHK